jgi:hypothetical protein
MSFIRQSLLILYVCCFSLLTYGQPFIQWQHCFGGSNQDFGNDIILTNDGGYALLAGAASSDGDVTGYHGGGLFDIWVIKLDSNFNMVWNKCYGNTATDAGFSINMTNDGGFIIGGQNSANGGDVTGNHGDADAWIIKIDSVGNIQWQKSFGSPYGDGCFYIEQTSDNGYIAACYAGTGGDVIVNYGIVDYWILKLDSAGNMQWQKTYGGSDIDYAKCVKQTIDGGYIIAGYTLSTDSNITFNHGNEDVWIIKTDSIGNIQWQKCYGGSGYDNMYGNGSILMTPANEYLICASTNSNDGDVNFNHGSNDYWLLIIDSIGNIIKQKTYGGSDEDELRSILPASNGGYFLAGYTLSNNGDVTLNHNPFDVWIVQTDSTGSILWQNTYGGSFSDAMNGSRFMVENNIGNYVIASTTFSNDGDVNGNHGPCDVWLFELNNATGIQETQTIILEPKAYPNPFSNILNLRIPYANEKITAVLSDPTGKIISFFNSQNKPENSLWNLNFDYLNLTPGIYFLSIKSSKIYQSIRLVKL